MAALTARAVPIDVAISTLGIVVAGAPASSLSAPDVVMRHNNINLYRPDWLPVGTFFPPGLYWLIMHPSRQIFYFEYGDFIAFHDETVLDVIQMRIANNWPLRSFFEQDIRNMQISTSHNPSISRINFDNGRRAYTMPLDSPIMQEIMRRATPLASHFPN